jgi:hypothetical protein
MDQEAIKKALDSFENDKFSDAKDILKKEIQSRRDEFLIDKLGLSPSEEPKDDDKDKE